MLAPEELHRQAGALFHQLADVPLEERNAALAACDPDLRGAVERLLRAEANATESFLDGVAMEAAARLIPAVEAPRTLGPYKIGPLVGSGGMGTVYEAQDRLGRRVAVKVLPAAFAADEERVRRFRRESQAISRLNHPNAVTIHDAGEFDGRHYIAMEYVEGQTLRRLMQQQGRPLESRQVIDIAAQICSALDAAHGAGVLHRDIKPENIMLRPDGVVKVLDFGLAKLDGPGGESQTQMLSRPGAVAGTIHYMAPEQVRGLAATPQSDLFSLGAVLYELATGARPFTGPTDGAIFDAILHQPPDLARLRHPQVDRELTAVILRALEKDSDLRFQTARDFRSALRLVGRDSSGSGLKIVTARPPVRRPWTWFAAGAAVASLAAALVWWRAARPEPLPAAVRTDAVPLMATEVQFPRLTPDGQQVVYAGRGDQDWDLYLQRSSGMNPVNVSPGSPGDDTEPAISPDGRWIAFRSSREGGGIFVSELTGENPRRVARRGHLPAWSPDGRRLVFSTESFRTPSIRGPLAGQLIELDLETGAEFPLKGVADALQPSYSPHGYRVAYWGMNANGQRDLFTTGTPQSPGAAVQLTRDQALDWNPVWSPDGGAIYFLSDRGGAMNLWRIQVDERSGRPLSAPLPITVPSAQVLHFSLSADGSSLIYTEAEQRTHLFRAPFDGARRVLTGAAEMVGGMGGPTLHNFSFSPDGKRLVYDTVGASQEDIWILEADGSKRRRLTDDRFMDRMPQWSREGSEIVFFSAKSGRFEEWVIQADGSGRKQISRNGTFTRALWSPGGGQILATASQGLPWLFDLKSGAGTPVQVRDPRIPKDLAVWDWPASGRILAVESGAEGEVEVVIYSVDSGAITRTGARGHSPAWLPGEQAFAFLRGSDCLVYDLARRTERVLFSVAPHEIYKLDFSQPGRLYYTQTFRRSQLWQAKLSLPAR